MKISVVMSSYNHSRFVGEAIQSVIDQDFGEFEFIIRDDGSSDETVKIISSYKDDRIKYLGSGPNIGGAASLNQCILAATGEYIALINSDDVFLPHRLSTQLPILEQNSKLGAVFSTAQVIDESGREIADKNNAYHSIFNRANRSRFEWLRYFFEHGNCLCHPSILIRRSCYEQLGLYDPLLVRLPDFEMWVRLCARHEIHIVDEPLLKFRLLNQEANASGDNIHNRESLLYEYIIVLAHFSSCPILKDISKVFPEFDSISDHDLKALSVALSKRALSVPLPSHHIFALNLHRSLIEKDASFEEIQQHLLMERSANPFSSLPDFCALKAECSDLLKTNAELARQNMQSKAREIELGDALTHAKSRTSTLKNSIEHWNGRSWFHRIFHKLRAPSDNTR